MVWTVLAVDVGLKLPHAALPQVTVQFTVAFCAPFAIVTAKFAVVLITIAGGGVNPCVKANETGLIVMVAETDFVLSVDKVAVIVTVLPVGTLAGAV